MEEKNIMIGIFPFPVSEKNKHVFQFKLNELIVIINLSCIDFHTKLGNLFHDEYGQQCIDHVNLIYYKNGKQYRIKFKSFEEEKSITLFGECDCKLREKLDKQNINYHSYLNTIIVENDEKSMIHFLTEIKNTILRN